MRPRNKRLKIWLSIIGSQIELWGLKTMANETKATTEKYIQPRGKLANKKIDKKKLSKTQI